MKQLNKETVIELLEKWYAIHEKGYEVDLENGRHKVIDTYAVRELIGNNHDSVIMTPTDPADAAGICQICIHHGMQNRDMTTGKVAVVLLYKKICERNKEIFPNSR